MSSRKAVTSKGLRVGRRVFQDTFSTPGGLMVLAQIRHMCGCGPAQKVFAKDPIQLAANASRADLFREIMFYLTVTDEQIEAAAERAAQMVGEDFEE